MVKSGQKSPGNELDMPNPKPKILFSILTLIKNYYIKVIPGKNSYVRWCESLVVFCFFCINLMMVSVSTYVILQGVNNDRN